MQAIQLTLNPERGFGLLMWGELLIDETGAPAFRKTKRAIRRLYTEGTPSYLRLQTAIVEVEIHEGDEEPTYVIGDVVG
jgi:hypothetical protein